MNLQEERREDQELQVHWKQIKDHVDLLAGLHFLMVNFLLSEGDKEELRNKTEVRGVQEGC